MGRPRTAFPLVISGALLSVGVGAAGMSSPTPEASLRGLERIEIVFTDVDRERFRAGVMSAGEGSDAASGTATASRDDLGADPECRAIAPALEKAGVKIVASCPPADPGCGRLLLSRELGPIAGRDERIYLVGVELIQRARLARDPSMEMASPVTWSERRFGIVDAHHSATRIACIQLRDLANWFGANWKSRNE